MLPPQWHPQEATAPTRKFTNLIIGVLLLVPPSQGHPHEAQDSCKMSYVIGATAKAIIHGYAPIPYARDAMAKAIIHGSATNIKTRWSRRRKAPPPREPSSKRRAMVIKLRSLLPPQSVQVHLRRRPWRRRRQWSYSRSSLRKAVMRGSTMGFPFDHGGDI